MIFLTVGTQLPFDRLTQAMDDWCAATGRGGEVFGQIGALGPGNHRPKHFDWSEWVTPDAFEARAQEAQVIVAHAGMGSIITALSQTKPVVILPRRADLGEQRNDHQMATVHQFEARPGIFAAATEAALTDAIARALAAAEGGSTDLLAPYASESLIAAVRDLIHSA